MPDCRSIIDSNKALNAKAKVTTSTIPSLFLNPNQNIDQAKKYFDDLTKYNASLHSSTKDLTSLSFEQLETLHKAVEKAKEKNREIKSHGKTTKDKNFES